MQYIRYTSVMSNDEQWPLQFFGFSGVGAVLGQCVMVYKTFLQNFTYTIGWSYNKQEQQELQVTLHREHCTTPLRQSLSIDFYLQVKEAERCAWMRLN